MPLIFLLFVQICLLIIMVSLEVSKAQMKFHSKRIALDQQIGKFRSPQIPGLGYILGAVCRWRGGARRRVSHVTAKWLLGISLHPHIWNLQLSSSSATVSQIEHWMLLTVLQWWIFCPRTFPIHIFFCTVFYQGLDYSRILLQCTVCVFGVNCWGLPS